MEKRQKACSQLLKIQSQRSEYEFDHWLLKDFLGALILWVYGSPGPQVLFPFAIIYCKHDSPPISCTNWFNLPHSLWGRNYHYCPFPDAKPGLWDLKQLARVTQQVSDHTGIHACHREGRTVFCKMCFLVLCPVPSRRAISLPSSSLFPSSYKTCCDTSHKEPRIQINCNQLYFSPDVKRLVKENALVSNTLFWH